MKTLLLVVALLALAGCSTPQLAKGLGSEGARIFHSDSGYCVLYVYRPSLFAGRSLHSKVYLDGKLLSVLDDGHFFVNTVPLGAHTLSVTDEWMSPVPTSFNFTAEGDTRKFVKLTYDWGEARKLEAVETNPGERDVSELYRAVSTP